MIDSRSIQHLAANWPRIYDAAVERLLNSPVPAERRHLFLGLALHGGYPVLYSREMQALGALFLGDPGSGKTAAFSALSTQMIAAADMRVVIVDMKGDRHLFEGARIAAADARLPFRWFTLVPGDSSFIFNPLEQSYRRGVTMTQDVQLLLTALGVIYKEIYGQSYYSAIHELHLMAILERFGPQVHSFADLYRFCSDRAANKGHGTPKDWENSRHLHDVLKRLAQPFQLNATERDLSGNPLPVRNAIQVEEMLTAPGVDYFCLPTLLESVTARSIAKLLLFGLIAAGTLFKFQNRSSVPVAIFMDEFHTLISEHIDKVLVQARDLKIGAFLAHQSLHQLKLGSELDLTQVVLASTAYKHVFRASDMTTRNYLLESSGEAFYESLAWEQPVAWGRVDGRTGRFEADHRSLQPPFVRPGALGASWGAPVSVSEYTGPRLTPNEIMAISANPATSFVSFTADMGLSHYHAAWTPIVSGYHITPADYDEAGKAPWPPANESCIVVPLRWQRGQSEVKGPVAAPKPADPIVRRIEDGLRGARAPRR